MHSAFISSNLQGYDVMVEYNN